MFDTRVVHQVTYNAVEQTLDADLVAAGAENFIEFDLRGAYEVIFTKVIVVHSNNTEMDKRKQ